MNALEFVSFMIEEEHKQIQNLLEKIEDKDLDYSIGNDETIGKRLEHMSAAEYRMSSYLDPKENEPKHEVEITVGGLKAAFNSSKNRHLAAIKNIKLDELEETWKSPRTGNELLKKWLVYHFIEHLATHRGQVTMALRLSKQT